MNLSKQYSVTISCCYIPQYHHGLSVCLISFPFGIGVVVVEAGSAMSRLTILLNNGDAVVGFEGRGHG